MPHILVGGATNQGKSVGLNAMIASLLYKKSPQELKLVLIDPKLTELTIYEEIEKQFRPSIPEIKRLIITDNTDEISETLQALCNEMRQRLTLFQRAKCRNIKEYNTHKWAKNAAYLPSIVIFIDEFAEIIKSKTIKESIILLARQARAAGIHLVVATQRPSATAISGDITANFPARIAFKVIKWQNSDIILGESGAEKLIGKGDMLFSNNSEIERLQGAFVSTDEVKRIVDFIEKQR
jgi:S-DNA-T family DNA segregation ATPase FtsK/SpoIIIE